MKYRVSETPRNGRRKCFAVTTGDAAYHEGDEKYFTAYANDISRRAVARRAPRYFLKRYENRHHQRR